MQTWGQPSANIQVQTDWLFSKYHTAVSPVHWLGALSVYGNVSTHASLSFSLKQ